MKRRKKEEERVKLRQTRGNRSIARRRGRKESDMQRTAMKTHAHPHNEIKHLPRKGRSRARKHFI